MDAGQATDGAGQVWTGALVAACAADVDAPVPDPPSPYGALQPEQQRGPAGRQV